MIATTQVPFREDDSDVLAHDLRAALEARGRAAEIVAVPFSGATAQDIVRGIMACRLLDVTDTPAGPVDRLIGMQFPAYLMRHPHKVLWVARQPREVDDVWDPGAGWHHVPEGQQRWSLIARAGRQALAEARAVFAVSEDVSRRLTQFAGVDALPLSPPAHRGARSANGGSAADDLGWNRVVDRLLA